MARGIMYHIAETSEAACGMDENYFYDSLDSLCVDFVQNRTQEEAKEDISNLVHALRCAGFTIGSYTGTGPNDEPVPDCATIVTGDEQTLHICKENYFRGKLDALKKAVSDLSLETFAEDTFATYNIRMLCEDTMDDAVYYGETYEGIHSLDGFIRRLSPNRVYYIAPETVLMH